MVDAGMRQLWSQGWLHNRARVVCASFLVKNLLLPWQWGLKHFWDCLVDADLESAALGWQYCSGCLNGACPPAPQAAAWQHGSRARAHNSPCAGPKICVLVVLVFGWSNATLGWQMCFCSSPDAPALHWTPFACKSGKRGVF